MAKKSNKPHETVGAEIAFVTLFDIQIDVEPVEDADDARLTYDIFITKPRQYEKNRYGFRTYISTGKKKDGAENNFIQVSAEYGCILSAAGIAESDVEKIAQYYAGTTVWGIYSSLFAVVTHQMRIEFPPIPSSPGKVETREVPSEALKDDESIV
jgi:hypothetical protein